MVPSYVGRSIEDGYYMVVSGSSNDYALDIHGGSQDNGGNLEIYDMANTPNQRFYVEYSDGYYTLRAVHSGKYLHIKGGLFPSTDVHQWDGNDHDNAKWDIIPAEDGYCYIRNKGNGKFLDNSYGRVRQGNNVIAYQFNGDSNQKWKFVKTGSGYERPIEDGYYAIISGNSNERTLDVNNWSQDNGGNLEIYNRNCTNNQIFYLEYNDGYYSIRAMHSGKYLHIQDETNPISNVHQWEGRDHDNAKWEVISAGDGYYYLRNKNNGSYLDNSGANTALGNNVGTYPFNATDAQKWKFASELVTSQLEIDRVAADNGKLQGTNAYDALMRINKEYSKKLIDDRVKLQNENKDRLYIFMFEGVGSDASSDLRKNAMCVVVKNEKIVYLNMYCSTIPDQPHNPWSTANEKGMPTLKDGIYDIQPVNHDGYRALNTSAKDAVPVVRFNKHKQYVDSAATGIYIHRRYNDFLRKNSQGCILIGRIPEEADDYLSFLKAIGLESEDVFELRPNEYWIEGKAVIDRNFAYDYLSNVGYSDEAIKMIRGY